MRFETIYLKWFRGASSEAELHFGGRSIVVFGANGAGKSSFVDGVEALLNGGKVGHLSHEYSGRHQEKGLINTARPMNEQSVVEITLVDGSAETLIWQSGSASRRKRGASSLTLWDYRRTALRQEELSGFIRADKAEKYSAILPLLGLSRLETVAENLRKLVKSIERKGDLAAARSKLALAIERRKEVFGESTNEDLLVRLEKLRITYTPDIENEAFVQIAQNIIDAIDSKISSLGDDQRRTAAIGEIGRSDIQSRIDKVFAAAEKIASVSEPLVKERLDVLTAARGFITIYQNDGELVVCPACGRAIKDFELREHVENERERLSVVKSLYDDHSIAISDVCDEVALLRSLVLKQDTSQWRKILPAQLQEACSFLHDISVVDLRKNCSSRDILWLQSTLSPLIARATQDATMLTPQVRILVEHLNEAKALLGSLQSGSQRAAIGRADALIKLLVEIEKCVREEIAEQARKTFETISQDIAKYWKFLQPTEIITDVRLIVPHDNDKAVEVALCFHGENQHSPRLTLSEGQRNALGLCIFLAMANKASSEDRPIILDDVVISFDRDHRSRVGTLLRHEFAARQVALLTHDREWFFELQRTLPIKEWGFYRLSPYTSPKSGIVFTDHGLDIATAKIRAKTDPEEALGNMRRIMDVALGEIAERIGLTLPYIRGDNNDHRTAGQFLVALERAATKSFRKKEAQTYVVHTEAVAAIKSMKPELAIWGNRGTHTFSGSPTEAEDLISSCEKVLNYFHCQNCNTPIGTFEASGEKVECRCGSLQWRPG